MPQPAGVNLDASAEIEVAMGSRQTLVQTFESDLKALVRASAG